MELRKWEELCFLSNPYSIGEALINPTALNNPVENSILAILKIMLVLILAGLLLIWALILSALCAGNPLNLIALE